MTSVISVVPEGGFRPSAGEGIEGLSFGLEDMPRLLAAMEEGLAHIDDVGQAESVKRREVAIAILHRAGSGMRAAHRR